MNEQEHARLEAHMLDIWFFTGLILLVYGLIIGVAGIYYIFHPPDVTLASLNPSLWWGALMAIAGTLFVVTSLKRRKTAIAVWDQAHGD